MEHRLTIFPIIIIMAKIILETLKAIMDLMLADSSS
jgi:hypothetical protein